MEGADGTFFGQLLWSKFYDMSRIPEFQGLCVRSEFLRNSVITYGICSKFLRLSEYMTIVLPSIDTNSGPDLVPLAPLASMAPPILGRSVNPIPSKKGRFCPPHYYWHSQLFSPSGISASSINQYTGIV